MKTSFPKDRISVLLLEGVHPRAAEILGAEGFSVVSHRDAPSEDRLVEMVREAHVVGIRSRTELTLRVLASSPRLLAIGCFCIGTNQVDVAAACLRGVPVFNAPFSNTRSVAELTLAEAIALTRGLPEKSAGMHEGVWEKSAAGAHEVRGRTIGIVGYGHIGSQVSVLAEALGMRVVFYDTARRLALGNARAARTLEELLAVSDVVTLHVPATPHTTQMIARAQLEAMKPGAVLINNARGSVVDIDDLAAALRSGRLAGAAIDVFPVEPSTPGEGFESPLRGIRSVILTPHIGGSTEEAQAAIAEDVCGKLVTFINNGSTSGAVNVPQVDLPGQEAPAVADEPGEGSKRRHRVLHFHRNVPGMLKQINGAAAELGANIAAQYLQTNADVGYVVLDVDPTDGQRLTDALRRIEGTIRVRMLW